MKEKNDKQQESMANSHVRFWQSSENIINTKWVHKVWIDSAPQWQYYLLEGELGVAGRAGKAVDTPGLVEGRHHWKKKIEEKESHESLSGIAIIWLTLNGFGLVWNSESHFQGDQNTVNVI